MMWLMVTNLSNTAHTHVMSPSFRRSLPHVHFKCVAFLFLKFCPRLWFLCANHERLVHVALSLTLCCRFFVFFCCLESVCARVCVRAWVSDWEESCSWSLNTDACECLCILWRFYCVDVCETTGKYSFADSQPWERGGGGVEKLPFV